MNVSETVREDDYVEYFVFPKLECTEFEREVQLRKLQETCEKIAENLVKEHIWHKDAFKLSPRTSTINELVNIETTSNDNTFSPHLYGVSHYGDNIEDEWIIVYILLELSKKLPEIVVRICDSDGEFLLIESAEFLPSWVRPENTERRVYINNGNVHIIPPELHCHPGTIHEHKLKTLASSEINAAIQKKVSGYPGKFTENLHTARAYVPVSVANILNQKPQLISPVVHAFCNRDTFDTKTIRAMKHFPPEHCVYTNVKFTKCLYAMLVNSKYVPDRRTGWNIPNSGPDFKTHSLGVKLACGFEILTSYAKPSPELTDDKSWNQFLEKLRAKNYFKGLLEHSVEYNKLMNTAKEFYIEHRDSMRISPKIGQEILEMNKNNNAMDYKTMENLPEPDDDSWLHVDPNQLEEYLQTNYGVKKTTGFNNNSDPKTFTNEVSKFLNKLSDVEGVEFRNKQASNNVVNFDPDQFSSAVQNILNFEIPEDSWNFEDSDMSEYEDEDATIPNDTKMSKYMAEMDKELARTTIGESFIKNKQNDSFEDIEDFKPVDIDVNALKNMMESYKSQHGEPGPSSTMLNSIGVRFNIQDEDT